MYRINIMKYHGFLDATRCIEPDKSPRPARGIPVGDNAKLRLIFPTKEQVFLNLLTFVLFFLLLLRVPSLKLKKMQALKLSLSVITHAATNSTQPRI